MRAAEEIDREVEDLASAAIAAGRGALVHLLDVSKTGASALSVAAARRIVARAPDRTLVLADCCQLRSPPARLRALANHGFLVALTGSKYAAGPPFSGALSAPRGCLGRMTAAALPRGLGALSARLDWPAEIRARIAVTAGVNPGLGLRWIAALSEMERLKTVPDDLVVEVHRRFRLEVERGAASLPGASLARPNATLASIFPVLLGPPGAGFSRDEACAVQVALREPLTCDPSRAFHVGQPVRIGGAHALRVCLSAPMINDVTERVRAGAPPERAFAPLAADLGELFGNWARIQKAVRRKG